MHLDLEKVKKQGNAAKCWNRSLGPRNFEVFLFLRKTIQKAMGSLECDLGEVPLCFEVLQWQHLEHVEGGQLHLLGGAGLWCGDFLVDFLWTWGVIWWIVGVIWRIVEVVWWIVEVIEWIFVVTFVAVLFTLGYTTECKVIYLNEGC